MIPQLQQIFHSLIKSLEILYVMEGAKPCARILVFEDEQKKVKGFLDEKSLHYSISDFKVLKQALQSDFYSDKSIKVSKGDERKGNFIFYISKGKINAEKAKMAESENGHFSLGMELGYPQCCCDFFEKNFDENNTDLTLKSLQNSAGIEFPFYNNVAARHFDVSLLSHFPHSFHCRPSIEIAEKNLEVIEKYSKQLAVMFSSVLQSAVIYTTDEGIFLLRKYEKTNGGIIYGDVISTAKSKLYFLVSSNNKLKIIDKNNFFVNDVNIKGDNYGILLFNSLF